MFKTKASTLEDKRLNLSITYRVLSPVNPVNSELFNFVSWLFVICLWNKPKTVDPISLLLSGSCSSVIWINYILNTDKNTTWIFRLDKDGTKLNITTKLYDLNSNKIFFTYNSLSIRLLLNALFSILLILFMARSSFCSCGTLAKAWLGIKVSSLPLKLSSVVWEGRFNGISVRPLEEQSTDVPKIVFWWSANGFMTMKEVRVHTDWDIYMHVCIYACIYIHVHVCAFM